MKTNAYKILIIIVILTIITFLLSLIFKKDYGFDETIIPDNEKIKGVSECAPPAKNFTLNGVDFLKSQLPIGKFGGEFVDYILSDPATFNPYNSGDSTSTIVSDIMYDGLVQTNPCNGEVVPKLAKSIEIKDNKTYIIHLRHGIKWSDGVEITSKDVYFTYNTVIFGGFGEGGTRDIMTIDGKMPSVKIIDKYTVEFKTPKPFAPFLRNLSASILPEHVFKNVTNKGQQYFLTYQGINVKPQDLVVSGAFKLKSYVPSQRVVMERNPNYYLINENNEKLPYINKWVMLIVGDPNNAALKFESGAIDALNVNGNLLQRYKSLKKQNNFELYNLGPSQNTTFVVFNLNNRKNANGKYYVNPIKQEWFQDRNFRTAIDWAIDRENLILNVFSGLASPLYSAEPVNSNFLNEKVAKGHIKNLSYAKQLLLKSGFYYKNDILYDKKGNRVEFELLTNAGNTQREAAGVSIKQDLEKLGIKINFKPVEFNLLVNKLVNAVDYDCIIIALTSNILEPNAGYNVWTSNGSSHLFNKRLSTDLKGSDKILDFERQLDDLFVKGALELDINKRKQIYNKYQEIVAYENPMVYLYAETGIKAIKNNIKNLYPTKIGGLIYDIAQIYIDND